MNEYSVLAEFYDELNAEVPYGKWAAFIESVFRRHRASPKLVLDLACGTGTVTKLLAERGYEMIASDASPEMLNRAREKCSDLAVPPVFICQKMQELDLYGTVGAVIINLDSVNYLTKRSDLLECFRRVHLFLEPGGLFLFDINTERKLRGFSGRAFVSEAPGVYCAWKAAFSEKRRVCRYDFDIFAYRKGGWSRFEETHYERAYRISEVRDALLEAGFLETPVLYKELCLKPGSEDDNRVFFAVKKEKNGG